MKKVWIVMYTECEIGSDSILGVFASEDRAKSFIVDYVLNNEIYTEYLEVTGKDVIA